LDRAALQTAARSFIGEHGFDSFTASHPDFATRRAGETDCGDEEDFPRSTVRTIFSSTWEERKSQSGIVLAYRVRGNGFLHHMVRNLVGTMIDVGRSEEQTS